MSEQWDGVPENPERDGWHWLCTFEGADLCCYWHKGWWTTPVGDLSLSPEDVADWRYLGPCLLPEEITAREAASAEQKRDMARDLARIEVAADMQAQGDALGEDWAATMRMMVARLFGGQTEEALARAVAAAEKRGMEKAAKWHDEQAGALAGEDRAGEANVQAAVRRVKAHWHTEQAAAIRNAAAQESEQ